MRRPERGREAPRERAELALLLAAVAGLVDGIGYLVLFHLFTAHMSGNTVAMGILVGGHEWRAALERAFPIPLYVLGAVIGAVMTEAGQRGRVRSVLVGPLALEAALLTAFMIALATGKPPVSEFTGLYVGLAALPAMAMGIQSTTLRHVSRHATVRTTFVTGMLTNFAERLADYLIWLRDRTRLTRRGGAGGACRGMACRWRRVLCVSSRHSALHDAWVFAGIWTMYAVGAVVAGFTTSRWGAWAIIIALIGLVGVIGCDLVRPIRGDP